MILNTDYANFSNVVNVFIKLLLLCLSWLIASITCIEISTIVFCAARDEIPCRCTR